MTLSTGQKVETPLGVGHVREINRERGRVGVVVERETDRVVHEFEPMTVVPYTEHEVGDVVYFRGDSVREHLRGYGVIVKKQDAGAGLFFYCLDMDSDSNAAEDEEQGRQLWSKARHLRALGSVIGDYPVWDDADDEANELIDGC